MKNLIRIEEGMMLILAIYLNTLLPAKGWIFWAFFLAPDIGFIGYAFGPAVGAWTYNAVHHKGIAIALYLLGSVWSMPAMQLAGLIMFGHSAFDRLLGYGLKFKDSFNHTHLGHIGKGGS
jgi:hypothetical protein